MNKTVKYLMDNIEKKSIYIYQKELEVYQLENKISELESYIKKIELDLISYKPMDVIDNDILKHIKL